MRKEGIEPVLIKLNKNITEQQAYMGEIIYYFIYLNQGHPLCNITLPGPGLSNRTGIKHSEEARRKISEAGKKRVLKEETKQKYKQYHCNRPLEHKTNLIKGKLQKSNLNEDQIKEIRLKFVNDVHLSTREIAQLMGLQNYDILTIGKGTRYKEVAPETIPTKEQIKKAISVRKSKTSTENVSKYWKKVKNKEIERPINSHYFKLLQQ